jgi:hypothetical protein
LPILPSWITESLCPYPDLRRKLSLGLAFILFGSVACVSSVTLLVADNDPDPRSAFALAPLPPVSRPIITSETIVEGPAAGTVAAPKITAADGVTPCPSNESGNVNGNCGTGLAQKRLLADPPATAETDYRNVPAAVPVPVALVASAPSTAEPTLESTDAPAPPSVSAEPVPAATASKPQKTARHQSRRRNPYDGFSLFAFDQRGRPRFRPLFW